MQLPTAQIVTLAVSLIELAIALSTYPLDGAEGMVSPTVRI